MAKKISEKDIFQGDIFKEAKQSAGDYLKMLESLQGELSAMLEINKKILEQSASQIKTTDGLKKRAKAIKDVTQASKSMEIVEREKVKTQRELSKLEADNERLLQQKNKTKIQERKEEERLAKIKAKNLKLAKQEGQAYSQMSKKLNELRNKYKNLAVQNKENTKEGKKLLKNIQQLDARLKKVDKAVGQSQRNVGNYTSAWGKLGMRLKSVASAFGLVGGVMGAVQVIKGAFNVVVDFDSAIANLGAISNATDEDMIALTKNAKALGESTKFTATEVAGLSVELAKLGFSSQEILDSTDSILALASATGTELADASFIAGSSLRAFNLEANEMDRVSSVLGVATTKSALNMEFLGTAMSKVAPVSSALGFSIEDTTALLGTLANAGFDASTSATATRNILLNLADASGDLAKALGRPVKDLDDLVPALSELEEKGIDVATALELTDKRSVSAFKTFLNNTDTITGLRDSITDVNSELAEMSEKQLDTISGQLALLNSKWQGMILGASKSTGVVKKLKNAIKFLTNNLETILKVGFNLVKWLAVYKTSMIAYNLVTKSGTNLTKLFGKAVVTSGGAVKKLGVLIRANPIGFLITAFMTLNALVDAFGRKTEEMIEKGSELGKKRVSEVEKAISKDLKKANDNALERIKARNLTEEEGLKLRAKMTNFVYDAEINKLEETIILKQKAFKDAMGEPRARARISGELEVIQKKQDDLKEIRQNNYNNILEESLKIKELELKENFEFAKSSKVINIFEKERNNLLIQRLKLLEEIRKEGLNNEISDIEKQLETELKIRTKQAEDIEFVKATALESGTLSDLTKYNELLNKRAELEKKQVEQSSLFAIQQKEIEQQNYIKTIEKSLKDGTILEDEFKSLKIDSEENLKKQIEIIYQKEKQSYKEIQDKKVKDTKEANEQIITTTNETIETISDAEIEANNLIVSKEKEALKSRLDAFKDFTNQIITLIDRQSDAKIQAINKELAESEKRENELRQLAIKGTTTAEQSIASEQKRQAELERQREELEKKKLRRQAILSGLDLLSSKLDNNEGDAVASTIRDITSLIGIIGNLPAFAEGTEFVNGGNAPKGKDKIIARIDEGERIMTKEQNKKLGNISNEDLTSMAQSWDNGIFNDINYIQPNIKKLNEPFQSSSMILSKFDELQKTIENKPMLTEVRWDEVSEMIIEKVETKNRIEKRHQSTKGIF